MESLTLIEMVRKTRANGHKFCAVDSDGEAYSFKEKPSKLKRTFAAKCISIGLTYLGSFSLSCNWENTLINVDKILVQ